VTARAKVRVGLAVCCFIVAAGCAKKEDPKPVSADPGVKVSCVAVLPVQPAIDYENVASPVEHKALKDGSEVMDGLLKQFFQGQPQIRFVSQEQARINEDNGAVDSLAGARRIAGQVGCNTILETTISQYTERVGGQYGAKQPAAVTFTYRLYEVGEGKVLCHGRFDEQQQSIMENLLTLPKAKKRGLSWVTAEELLREGVQEKLGQCSYLEGK
jgi:hypothetical protein